MQRGFKDFLQTPRGSNYPLVSGGCKYLPRLPCRVTKTDRLVGRTIVQWDLGPRSADFRHLALHVSKVAGIACSLAEKMDHGDNQAAAWEDFNTKRLPDLVILAAMIAQVQGLDLSTLIAARGESRLGNKP